LQTNFKWLAFLDDDVILSVSKLLELMQQYEAFSDDEDIALGER
jgi:hypothetical protein